MNDQIRTAAQLDALPDEARMDAYYYSFDRTGVGPVDAILSAVAVAGKGSHHTDGWQDVSDYYYKERPGLPDADSGMDLIQLTANQSAEQIRSALARPDEPQRVQPSREDVRGAVVSGWREDFDEGGKYGPIFDSEAATDAVLALLDGRTEAEVKAEVLPVIDAKLLDGLRAAEARLRSIEHHWPADTCAEVVVILERLNADRLEAEARHG